MNVNRRNTLVIEAYPSNAAEIGIWLWAIQDTRRRTLETLDGLNEAEVDWRSKDDESSIGTVLYHIADIEADWLYAEVLEQPIPAELMNLFPYPTRDKHGRLVQVQGFSLEQHLERLEAVRTLLLDVFKHMDLQEFQRIRSLENYDVTPEWVLHHLMQHEAEHRGQIGSLRDRMKSSLEST